jgi:hypothetical protein
MGALEEKTHELWEAARHISNFIGCDGAEVAKLVAQYQQEGRGESSDLGDIILLALGKIALRRKLETDPGYHLE